MLTETLALEVGAGTLVLLGLGLVVVVLDRRLRTVYTEELRARQRRYETLLTEISDVVTVLDEDGTIRYESPSIRQLAGYEPEELVGTSGYDLVHPDDVEAVADAFGELLASPGEEGTIQYRFRVADGSYRTVESTGVVPDHGELGPVVVTRDITERLQSRQKYRAIFSTNPSAVGLATLDEGRFVEVNRSFAELLGHAREEVVGSTASELGVWADPGERDRFLARLREPGSVHNIETQFRTRDGEVLDVLFSGSVLELEGTEYLVGAAQDITERKAFEAELERRALHDSLTDLPNRSLFRDRLEHALERAERDETGVAVLFLDVDRFKTVNDSLGHPAGDAVLRSVASRLVNALREEDTVARVGGDEFAILLEEFDPEEGVDPIVSRIQRAFEVPFRVGESEFTLSASIGVAHTGLPHEVGDDLVRLADAAMYRAKGPGTIDYHVFDPGQDRAVTDRLQRESDLERAIRAGELVVHFQPVVRLDSEATVGAEALVRWDHPERGLVFPGEFIPLAEESGLIVPLGREVLRLALREAECWRDEGLVAPGAFRLGVNLSAREYQEGDLVASVAEAAESASVPLSMLTVEITETIAVTERDRLQPLRERGLRLAIDDFGTGYSSLEYLRHLEADTLKVDRSFVDGLRRGKREETIVRAMLFMAREMGMDAVAEGVETEAQHEWLREAGCPEGQGYYFGRPVSAGEFEGLLRGEAGAEGVGPAG